MRSDDVRTAAEACTGFLGGAVGRDWSARAGTLDMSVAEVVAHVAAALYWYAADLAGGPEGGPEREALDLTVRADRPPEVLLATVGSAATVLAAVVDASPDDIRGYHPDGAADPSGFAAMACDELLLHTDDAARGLGLAFEPDAHLAAHVLRRLFPWAPHDERSWPTLRWANGRAPLGDRPRLTDWRWHCAPWTSGTAPPRNPRVGTFGRPKHTLTTCAGPPLHDNRRHRTTRIAGDALPAGGSQRADGRRRPARGTVRSAMGCRRRRHLGPAFLAHPTPTLATVTFGLPKVPTRAPGSADSRGGAGRGGRVGQGARAVSAARSTRRW
ncbi:hypothetical protein GCM10009836_30010 [Pseudonocardia ailaonensis]|uniref:Mycothiol-dependent maleylpyruvate isomerase metal-binding domain-containing protein n=1 Tax=Pseudonocardia ailaonensis TaxID=367279 RepID=A0ABN2N209_9PSEU